MFDLDGKIRKLKALFTEHERIEDEIAAVLSEGFVNSGEIRKLRKKRGRKPKQQISYSEKRPMGRPRKVREYLCADCGHSFKSNLPLIDAQCPSCRSVNIETGTMNGDIIEEDN
jgi:predicted Zn-ribbon and HTH transcriptional regulator